MKRTEVYEAISSEREYQDTVRKIEEKDTTPDSEKSVADFIIFIENKLNEAKKNIYNLDKEGALDDIRKIAGICVACGEAHGFKKRNI